MQEIRINHVLVTGAGGFIGKSVVEVLLQQGYEVTAMVRPLAIAPFVPTQNLHILFADISDYDSFANQVKSVDAIVHLAANKYHPKLAPMVNIGGAKNLVRLFQDKKIRGKRLINISTQSTKIRYKGVYGRTKQQSDEIIQAAKINWTTIKPSLVYGAEKGTLVDTIASYIKKLPFVPVMGNGKWELFPISADDLAFAIVQCLRKPASIHQVYDLGGREKVTFDELILEIQQQLNLKKPIVHIPLWIAVPLVFVATKIIPNLPISVDNVLGSNQDNQTEPLRAIKELSFKPITVKAGIRKYLIDTKSADAISVAMVGLGKMGILHSTVLSTLPNAKITALVDKDVALAKTAQSMGIQAHAYASLSDALKKETIDAVYICTPTFAHKEIINLCLKHNLPFFVEKPVFTNAQDFTDLIKTKTKSLNQSGFGYFWIYKREVQFTKQLLDQNMLGPITNYTINLYHSEVFGPKKGWLFTKKLSGGGVLANPGPHAFSILTYLFGKATVTDAHITSLFGNDVEDEAHVSLQHSNKKITGTLNASWSTKGYPVLTIAFEISGENGMISFKNNTLTVAQKGKPKKNYAYHEIPQAYQTFNLNPKAGGDAYYIEDMLFINHLQSNKPIAHNIELGQAIEQAVYQTYDKA